MFLSHIMKFVSVRPQSADLTEPYTHLLLPKNNKRHRTYTSRYTAALGDMYLKSRYNPVPLVGFIVLCAFQMFLENSSDLKTDRDQTMRRSLMVHCLYGVSKIEFVLFIILNLLF